MYICLHVKKTHYTCHFLTKLEFSDKFEKKILIKFNENLSSGSQVVPCGLPDGRTDEQKDTTKLIQCF